MMIYAMVITRLDYFNSICGAIPGPDTETAVGAEYGSMAVNCIISVDTYPTNTVPTALATYQVPRYSDHL